MLLALAYGALAADRAAETAVAGAIRTYSFILVGRADASQVESVRDTIAANIGGCGPRVAASIRRQLDRGFDPKYKQDTAFHKVTAEALASCGEQGVNMLWKRFKGSSKRDDLRIVIAEALGGYGDPSALDALLKMMHDGLPEAVAAAVASCTRYAKVKPERRKEAMRQLVDRYRQITDDAAGKEQDAREMHMYRKVKPAMDATLEAFSGGERLDSAQAWDAWLRENVTRPWPE